MKFDRNSDVTKNVKIIEWMKKELILSVGDVFDLIFKGSTSRYFSKYNNDNIFIS